MINSLPYMQKLQIRKIFCFTDIFFSKVKRELHKESIPCQGLPEAFLCRYTVQLFYQELKNPSDCLKTDNKTYICL